MESLNMNETDLILHHIYYYDGKSPIFKLPSEVKTKEDIQTWLKKVLYYVSGAYIKKVEVENGNIKIKCVYEGLSEIYPFNVILEVMKRTKGLYVAIRLEQTEHPLLEDILQMKFFPDLIKQGELEEVIISREEYTVM
jgi:hypothetical protein